MCFLPILRSLQGHFRNRDSDPDHIGQTIDLTREDDGKIVAAAAETFSNSHAGHSE
jgi:hypothetical protein